MCVTVIIPTNVPGFVLPLFVQMFYMFKGLPVILTDARASCMNGHRWGLCAATAFITSRPVEICSECLAWYPPQWRCSSCSLLFLGRYYNHHTHTHTHTHAHAHTHVRIHTHTYKQILCSVHLWPIDWIAFFLLFSGFSVLYGLSFKYCSNICYYFFNKAN